MRRPTEFWLQTILALGLLTGPAWTAEVAGMNSVLAVPSADESTIGGSAVVIATGQAMTLQEAFPAPVAVGATVTLLLPSGERRHATVLRATGSSTGVLLALDTTGLLPLSLAPPTDPAALGAVVWTVGNSSGAIEDDGPPAVSRGTLSGRYILPSDGPAVRGRGGRVLSAVNGPVIEIDAAVNDGNQGGAVVDDAGHLIALASLAVTRERRLGTAVPMARLYADLGVAMPAATAATTAPQPPPVPLPAGLVLVAFDRPAGLGNPDSVARPPKTIDQVPVYERTRLENWWDAYHHNQQILWTDTPAPALVIDAAQGLLLTAASQLHGEAVSGRLLGPGGSTIAVRVLAIDTPLDLALLVAEQPLSLPAAVIAPRTPELGEAISVIARFAEGMTRTAGHVTCVDRRLDRADQGFLQVDARAGYSSLGGALIDADGTIVGLVVKAGPELPWYVNSGVTLAISGAIIAEALPALRAGTSRKQLPRLTLGVILQTRDEQLVLLRITSGSGAEAAGLAVDDVLLSVDGRPASSHEAVTRALLRHHVGDRVRVAFRRGGRPLAAEVELRELPP